MPGRIFQLSTSPGGVPKLAVREALILEMGMDGDSHRFPEIHGGPDRALCLFSLERIMQLQEEGHPIFPGAVGENVTISGLDWDTIVPGVRLMLGQDVMAEIVKYTSPCNSIPEFFADGRYDRISQKVHPGWSRVYARVLKGGRLVVGQSVNPIDGIPRLSIGR